MTGTFKHVKNSWKKTKKGKHAEKKRNKTGKKRRTCFFCCSTKVNISYGSGFPNLFSPKICNSKHEWSKEGWAADSWHLFIFLRSCRGFVFQTIYMISLLPPVVSGPARGLLEHSTSWRLLVLHKPKMSMLKRFKLYTERGLRESK